MSIEDTKYSLNSKRNKGRIKRDGWHNFFTVTSTSAGHRNMTKGLLIEMQVQTYKVPFKPSSTEKQ